MTSFAPKNSDRQLRKGILEHAILLALERGKEVYASDILNTLRGVRLFVTEGTLYPILSRFRKKEFVTYQKRAAKHGPPRKYYSLTKKGRDALKEMNKNWLVLSESIALLFG